LALDSRAMRHGQAEALLPMVDAAMRRAALPASALDLVAATVGPGSFTGIRAGLAAARGIALAARLPLFGVTGFAAIAAAERDRGAGQLLLVALESRRAELFVQLFVAGRPQGDPAAVLPAALPAWVEARCSDAPLLVVGEAAARTAAALGERSLTTLAEAQTSAVVGVVREASRRWRLGELPERPEPLYLRPPDVTLPPGPLALRPGGAR
jgi:tRNA threonylcarbamoyladenosine biosynthesis protein TsaB